MSRMGPTVVVGPHSGGGMGPHGGGAGDHLTWFWARATGHSRGQLQGFKNQLALHWSYSLQ